MAIIYTIIVKINEREKGGDREPAEKETHTQRNRETEEGCGLNECREVDKDRDPI